MRILGTLVLLAGFSLLGQMFGQTTPSLTTEELEKHLKDKKRIFLLDVREPKEISELGSVKGYVNIPLGQLEGRLDEIPKDKLIITL
jgi:rhodanese-related sulfurtransferase